MCINNSWHFFTPIEGLSDGLNWPHLKRPPFRSRDTSIAVGKSNRQIGQAFFPFMISRLLSANLSQHPNNTAIIIIIYHHSSTYSNTIFPPPWFGDCRLVKINICLYLALYVIYVRWPVCDVMVMCIKLFECVNRSMRSSTSRSTYTYI